MIIVTSDRTNGGGREGGNRKDQEGEAKEMDSEMTNRVEDEARKLEEKEKRGK